MQRKSIFDSREKTVGIVLAVSLLGSTILHLINPNIFAGGMF